MANIEKGTALHRAFSVFLFNSNNELLLQKRAACKITFPNFWTNTVCSHPIQFVDQDGVPVTEQPEMEASNQTGVKKAAIRKLYQELGIESSEVPIQNFKFLTRIIYQAASDTVWGEHEVDYILFIKANVKVNPNENEVGDFKYVSKEKLKEFMANSDSENLSFTPWFKLIVENFLYSWWDRLDADLPTDDLVHDLKK